MELPRDVQLELISNFDNIDQYIDIYQTNLSYRDLLDDPIVLRFLRQDIMDKYPIMRQKKNIPINSFKDFVIWYKTKYSPLERYSSLIDNGYSNEAYFYLQDNIKDLLDDILKRMQNMKELYSLNKFFDILEKYGVSVEIDIYRHWKDIDIETNHKYSSPEKLINEYEKNIEKRDRFIKDKKILFNTPFGNILRILAYVKEYLKIGTKGRLMFTPEQVRLYDSLFGVFKECGSVLHALFRNYINNASEYEVNSDSQLLIFFFKNSNISRRSEDIYRMAIEKNPYIFRVLYFYMLEKNVNILDMISNRLRASIEKMYRGTFDKYNRLRESKYYIETYKNSIISVQLTDDSRIDFIKDIWFNYAFGNYFKINFNIIGVDDIINSLKQLIIEGELSGIDYEYMINRLREIVTEISLRDRKQLEDEIDYHISRSKNTLNELKTIIDIDDTSVDELEKLQDIYRNERNIISDKENISENINVLNNWIMGL